MSCWRSIVFCLVVAILTICESSALYAGGMVSSGGAILRDANNPWWIKNTSQVNYCVLIDTNSISAQPAKTKLLIEKALQYWGQEFQRGIQLVKNANELNFYFNEIGVGKQKFVLENCNNKTDLKFIIGHGGLSPEQRAEITNIDQIIGLTIREQYDSVELKGKGFIYIASDLGPNRFEGGKHLVDTPWTNDVLLFAALIHELGHVFGLPHVGEKFTLLSEQFLEFILNRDVAKFLAPIDLTSYQPIPFYFSVTDNMVYCPDSGNSETLPLFGSLERGECLLLSINSKSKSIDVGAFQSKPLKYQKIGTINKLDLIGEFSSAVTLALSDLQKIFPGLGGGAPGLRYLPGPSVMTMTGSANFEDLNGKSQSVYLRFNPNSFEILGMIAGKLQSALRGTVQLQSEAKSSGLLRAH